VFTRDRKLNFSTLIILIMRGIKSSLQRELDSFSKEVARTDFDIREVTKGAFTQARAKLNPSAFVEMNENIVGTFYSGAPYIRWLNHRLLVCDGSRLTLPCHETVRAGFGEHGFGPNADSMKSLGTCSFLYDPLNFMVLDAQLEGYTTSEQELLDRHLPKVGPGDLLLLDRGYPSIALMLRLQYQEADFCIRLSDHWLAAKALKESGGKEQVVRLVLPKKENHLKETYPGMKTEMEVRLICVGLESGEKEVLCTSLMDAGTYTHEDFSELYHCRWGIEESFKLFKSRAEVENFSGRTARSVRQDFHAKVFMMSFMALMAFPIEEKVKDEAAKNTDSHPKKINRTSALAMASKIVVGLFIHKSIKNAIKAFDALVYKTTEIVRGGRRFERKHKPKKHYHMNYKRL
jgi:hypothetical protein